MTDADMEREKKKGRDREVKETTRKKKKGFSPT